MALGAGGIAPSVVEQTCDNYRFFGVRTEEEIREIVGGER